MQMVEEIFRLKKVRNYHALSENYIYIQLYIHIHSAIVQTGKFILEQLDLQAQFSTTWTAWYTETNWSR